MRDQPRPPVVVAAAARTDVGHKRELNEDSYLCVAPIFLVADGMGGHDAGEVASAAVVRAFQTLAGNGPTSVEHVAEAIAQANADVAALSAGQRHGAGSTVTGVAQVEHDGRAHWLIFNLGDSRVYRMQGETFLQLTKDHSLVQELVDQGTLTPVQAARSKHKNVITRAVGAEYSVPDFWLAPVVTGERLLICSDGLYGEVEQDTLKALLMLSGTVQDTASALIRAALQHGGRDNVTAIVLDVISGGMNAAEDAATGGMLTESSSIQVVPQEENETTVPGRRRRHG